MDVIQSLLLISITTTLFILYKIPIVRYYTKYFSFLMIMQVGSIFYTIKFLIKGKPSYENSCDVIPLIHLSQNVLGLRPKIYGLENCYAYRQCIYVINHQSFVDSIVVARLWREPCSVIVKDSLRYVGLCWPMMYFTKILSIVRDDHDQAMATMRNALDMVKNEHVNMFIFPEGTRNRNGDHLLPFKKGAFHLAIQAQLPIVPVVISSYTSFLDHKNKIFDDASYGVYILKPIPTEGLTSSDAGRLMRQTQDAMSEIFELTTRSAKEDLWMDVRCMTIPENNNVRKDEVKKEEEEVKEKEKQQDTPVEEAKQ